MIHKTTRSILSVLLAVLLLVTSIPLTPAFAGGGAVSLQSESVESRALEKAGDGTYLIYTAENLKEFAVIVNGTDSTPADSDADARLMNDIDLNGSEENPWIPIGSISRPYSGTFDGNGHKIENLYINTTDSGADNQGLFGYVGSEGTVQNLTVSGSVKGDDYVGGVVGQNHGSVENCDFTGSVKGNNNYIGGVVGYNGGTVENCYNIGEVSGNYVGGVVGYNGANVENCYNTGSGTVKGNNYVGGVVGWNSSGGGVTNCYNTGSVNGSGNSVGGVVGDNSGTVENCYNTGSVSGNSYVGGVVGWNASGTVKNCYNTGAVNSSGNYVGGVAGYNSGTVENCYNTGTVSDGITSGGVVGQNSGSVTNCYFLTGTAKKGIGNEADATGATVVTSLNVQDQFQGWDFDNTWRISTDKKHPVLQANAEDNALSGTGKQEDPYKIYRAIDLKNFRDLVNDGGEKSAHAKLMDDIDLSSVCSKAKGNWNPIGNIRRPYSGTFNGDGHTISGLYIGTTVNNQGLFGYLSTDGDNTGTVKDLTVSGTVSGNYNVGGVVGYNNGGTVTGCIFSGSGSVSGKNYVGGVVGYNDGGIVTGCIFSGSGSVSGEWYVGGIAGRNNGTVENCYNTGQVNGSADSSDVGGVVGLNRGTVENCYNTGTVTGTNDYVGGVVGYNNEARVENCYNTGEVSGNSYVGGVVGYNNEGRVENCYNTGEVSGNSYVGGVVGDNRDTVENCYYQQHDPAIFGIGGTTADDTTTVAKTAAEFHSGEVAYLLQSKQTAGSSQVWGQTLGGEEDSLPTLNPTDEQRVYQVTFYYGDSFTETDDRYDYHYANANDNVTLPTSTDQIPEYEGHTLTGWQNGTNTYQAGEEVEITADTEFTAQWTKDTVNYTVTVTTSPAEGGTVNGGGTFAEGTQVTVTATANDGYTFVAWQEGGTKIENAGTSYTFTVNGNRSLTAVFEKDEDPDPTPTPTPDPEEPPYSGKYSYEVSTSVGDHGSLTVDRYATEGDEVTIIVTPDEAYKLDDLSVTAHGKDVELTANGDGTYTFTMPSADVKISATFAEDPDWTEPEEPSTDVSDLFIDIAPDAWYKDAVQYAYDNGLMTGVSATEFAPEATTTRAMIVSILARLEGVTTAEAAGFADVDDNDWYATAVNWAANVGVVNGYEDNTFKPNTAITREQLAAILMNYAAYKGEDVSNRADLTSYTDQPSTWAQEAMQWAVAEKLITGVTNDELQPQSSATRAQVAAILQRFLDK